MRNSILAIVGPTGSGKSDLGIFLAERLNGEIVNCDSVQIYRGFDIGSAKTAISDRRAIPHHLIDIAEPDETFTAGDYAKRARVVIEDISSRDKLAIVVGGTGFYLRALFEGLFPGPQRDEEIRSRLAAREQRRPGSLHRILARLDSAAAARIHRNDTNKLIRALEVRIISKQPLTAMFDQGRDALKGFQIVKVGLNPSRDALYERLNARFERMVEQGLLDEVRRLLDSGVREQAKPFESLGYKQALALLRGESSLDDAIERAQMQTRRYSKRQMTWFRREPDVTWFTGFGDSCDVKQQVFAFAQSALQVS